MVTSYTLTIAVLAKHRNYYSMLVNVVLDNSSVQSSTAAQTICSVVVKGLDNL